MTIRETKRFRSLYKAGHTAGRDGDISKSPPQVFEFTEVNRYDKENWLRGFQEGHEIFNLELKWRETHNQYPAALNRRFWDKQPIDSPCHGCMNTAVCGLFALSCTAFNHWIMPNEHRRHLTPNVKIPSRRLFEQQAVK